MLLEGCDVVYGENVFATDEKLELFRQFQEQAPEEFCNAIYVWLSGWAKNSGLTKEEQSLRVRSLMKVLTFPLAVFYSVKDASFDTLTIEHITQPGEGVTEEMMHEMLNSVHPGFSDKLRAYLQEASLPDYLNRVVYWVTFALIEALGVSTRELLQKVSVRTHQ